MDKIKRIIKDYISLPSRIIFVFALYSVIIHIVSANSVKFSDFYNKTVASVIRAIPAKLTMYLPFSLAETVIVLIPLWIFVIIYLCLHYSKISDKRVRRFIVTLFSVATLFYSMMVNTTVVSYNSSPLEKKLSLEKEAVSTDELFDTAKYMLEKIGEEKGKINYSKDGSSVMPYSLDEMSDRLNEAFVQLSGKYDFLPVINTKIKKVALSVPWTYTHISGMYTYYTGEANLNINFPDYTLPFTAAHELSHQRGVLPENEANFVAFLVCVQSEDAYIRYSGYMNMFDYIYSACVSADKDRLGELSEYMTDELYGEWEAYDNFFEKYEKNTAADVMSTVNDTYLKIQGVAEGEKSYGMVVDLAVAYVKALK